MLTVVTGHVIRFAMSSGRGSNATTPPVVEFVSAAETAAATERARKGATARAKRRGTTLRVYDSDEDGGGDLGDAVGGKRDGGKRRRGAAGEMGVGARGGRAAVDHSKAVMAADSDAESGGAGAGEEEEAVGGFGDALSRLLAAAPAAASAAKVRGPCVARGARACLR